MPGEHDGGGNCVGFEVATWRRMKLTITTDAIIVTATTNQCRSVTCEGWRGGQRVIRFQVSNVGDRVDGRPLSSH
jgi:hypothetical protein